MKTRPLMFVSPNQTASVAIDATTTITVRCNPNTSFAISVDQGQHSTLLNRRMFSALSNNHVVYEVYRDPLRLLVWSTGPLNSVTGNSGSGSPIDIPIYGRVPAAALIAAGDYKDTLTVILNF